MTQIIINIIPDGHKGGGHCGCDCECDDVKVCCNDEAACCGGECGDDCCDDKCTCGDCEECKMNKMEKKPEVKTETKV